MNLRAGSGGRRLCEHCDRLNKAHYRGGFFASLSSASSPTYSTKPLALQILDVSEQEV